MPSEKRKWKFRLRHMLEAIEECRRFVEGMTYAEFCADAKTMKAIVWNIATLGEAAGQVPEAARQAYPGVPWADVRGMRNHIVHAYDRIDPEIVWQVVQEELPPLVYELRRIEREAEE